MYASRGLPGYACTPILSYFCSRILITFFLNASETISELLSSMDAHTLNAWTRFALQKGGIGSCTALIDNPATDLEDLMFMAGEKIVVLRKLDDDISDSGRRRSANGEAESWYLVRTAYGLFLRSWTLVLPDLTPFSCRATAKASLDDSKAPTYSFTAN